MQILTNALPGVRDLRAPLIAGYMWLLAAYLIVDPNLDRRPAGSLAASIYDLARKIGSIWVAIAIGVAAYLIGSVSQEVSRLLHVATRRTELGEYLSRNFKISVDDQLRPSLDRGWEALNAVPPQALSDRDRHTLRRELDAKVKEARVEAERELDLPATLLISDRSELFAEVDRLRAEGDLRMAVAPPLTGLMAVLTLGSSSLWLLLAPAIVALFFQGMQRDLDSRKIIADAIRINRIKSSSVEKFSQWVEEVFFREVNRAQSGSEASA